jgi:hypothetical protein
MPSVSDVPPPKPVLPAIPARLLSSASAPSLAATSAADPGYRECLAALAVVSAEPNPEDDPGYRESWDAYWARVRPQRSRPYDKACLTSSPLKREKGNLLPFLFVSFSIVSGRGGKKGLFFVLKIRLAVLVPSLTRSEKRNRK